MTTNTRIPPERWPEVSALFDQAMALPPEAQTPWLQALDSAQPQLAPFVRRLLAAHATSDTLPRPDAALLRAALSAHGAPLAPGMDIAIYRLVQPLGQGGMAAVWLAEQQQGVQRRVALKLPHLGVEAPAAMAERFAQERDLLASLEHPHIARLYDAGFSEAGQPYLAMELIAGTSITTHCQALPVRQQLHVFLQVLEAVSFAHGRMVVHRDIKPGNVLVTRGGEVKLLDFGIARLLSDTDGATAAAPGPLSGRAFTPDCASPEQLAGATLGAVSDVYSLGVVLYELLSGARPYVIDRQSAMPLTQQLAAADVRPPSTVAGPLQRELRGDLDAIVARAMAPDPAQRYASADALAADIRRHLNILPVHARGTGRRYRTARFLRRHALGLAAGGAVVGALAVGLGVALWQTSQAREQAQRAKAVQHFIVEVFNASHPQQAQGQPVPAKSLLDQGAKRLATELKDQPAVRAELHLEVGGIYNALGDNAQAQQQIDQALALYAQLGQLDSERAVEAQFQQFELLKEEQQFDAAKAAADRVLVHAARGFGPQHKWLLATRENLAWIASQQGDSTAAERLLQQAIAEASPGSDPVRLLRMRTTQGNVKLDLGQTAAARDIFAAVVADGGRTPGHETTDQLIDRYNLARARYILGEYAAVADETARLVPAMDRHIGPQHDRTLKARGLWAQAAIEMGHYSRAVDIQRENLANAMARDAADDDVTSLQRLTLAKVLRLAGRYAEGVPEAQQGLAFMDNKYSQPTWFRVRGRWIMAELLLGLGQYREGLAALQQAVELGSRIDGAQDNPAYADVLQAQGLAIGLGARTDALPAALDLLARAHAIYANKLGAQSAAVRRAALHRLWLQRLAQPAAPGAKEAFESSAVDWAKATPLAAAEVALMRAEALARSGLPGPARAERERGAAAWSAALGVPWSGHFIGLH